MLKQVTKTLAILLAVCFMVTVTVGARSIRIIDNEDGSVREEHHKPVHNLQYKKLY